MSFRRISFAVLIVCLCVPFLAACQSADSGSKEAGSSAQLKGVQLTKQDIKLAADYTGGTPGTKATKSPIRIGYIKVTTGASAFDPDSIAATGKLINNDLGGVDGHPIQFVACDTGSSEAQAQQCGQKFRSDPNMVAVIDPNLPEGGLALFGALNGAKPTFCAAPFQPELLASNVFCVTGGVISSPTFVTYLKDYTNAKTVAAIVPDDPTFRQIGAISEKAYKANGVKATTAYIPKGTPDISAPLIAAGVQKADAIVVTVPNDSQCISVAQALKSLNVSDKTKIIGLPTCADTAVRKALGGEIPKWTYFDLGPSPIALDSPELTVFRDTVHTYDNGESQLFANTRFSATMWMARVLNQVGAANLTPATVTKAARDYTGPVFMGYPDIKFGQQPYVNFGMMKSRFFNYLGSDKWEDATDGKWVALPAPVVEK